MCRCAAPAAQSGIGARRSVRRVLRRCRPATLGRSGPRVAFRAGGSPTPHSPRPRPVPLRARRLAGSHGRLRRPPNAGQGQANGLARCAPWTGAVKMRRSRLRGTQPEGLSVRGSRADTSFTTRRALRRAPVPDCAAAPRNGTSTEPSAPRLRHACGAPAQPSSPTPVTAHARGTAAEPSRPSEALGDGRCSAGPPQAGRSLGAAGSVTCRCAAPAAQSGTGARRSARRVLRRCRPAALGRRGPRVATLAAGPVPCWRKPVRSAQRRERSERGVHPPPPRSPQVHHTPLPRTRVQLHHLGPVRVAFGADGEAPAVGGGVLGAVAAVAEGRQA